MKNNLIGNKPIFKIFCANKLRIVAFLTTILSFPNILYAAQQLHLSGPFTNTTANKSGNAIMDMTINDDNTLTGYTNFTNYPNVGIICGAGDFTGTISGNNIELSFISNDPDPGCGFDRGIINYFTATLSETNNETVLRGSYLLSNGQRGIYRLTTSGWGDLEPLKSYYQLKKDTNQAPFIHQVLCIADTSCQNFINNGTNSWAGGFVRHQFRHMTTPNGLTDSVTTSCPDMVLLPGVTVPMPPLLCFEEMGEVHRGELRRGFTSYCFQASSENDFVKWDQDHQNFLDNAVVPCFDEVASAGELSTTSAAFFKASVPAFASTLRETIQALCGVIVFGFSPNLLAESTKGTIPTLPPPLTREQLFSENLAAEGTLDVTAAQDAFFLPVGTNIQLNVIRNNPGGGTTDLTGSGNNIYSIQTEAQNATISSDGILSITGTSSSLTSITPKLLIVVTNGNDYGIGQFAITDVDSDGDFMVDSYEGKEGLNPNFQDSLQRDTDFDKIPNLLETLLGTDLRNKDTDGDGFDDRFEVNAGSDPLDPYCNPIEGCKDTTFEDGFENNNAP